MSWTDERIATLKKMWEGGSTASQIADELGGVSRNAVIGKVHRLGLAGRATPARAERPRLQTVRRVARPRQTRSVARCTHPLAAACRNETQRTGMGRAASCRHHGTPHDITRRETT